MVIIVRKRKSLQRIYWLIRHYSELADLTIAAHPHMLIHGCGFALADGELILV